MTLEGSLPGDDLRGASLRFTAHLHKQEQLP
jgi:hypothetical protein